MNNLKSYWMIESFSTHFPTLQAARIELLGYLEKAQMMNVGIEYNISHVVNGFITFKVIAKVKDDHHLHLSRPLRI